MQEAHGLRVEYVHTNKSMTIEVRDSEKDTLLEIVRSTGTEGLLAVVVAKEFHMTPGVAIDLAEHIAKMATYTPSHEIEE